jgi:hypothetical protein
MYWSSDNYGKPPSKKDRIVSIGAGIFILVFLFILALGVARGHGTHVEEDPCTIVYEVKTDRGTIYQWCDLDGDSDAELVQEIILSIGGLHYLDIFSPDDARLKDEN